MVETCALIHGKTALCNGIITSFSGGTQATTVCFCHLSYSSPHANTVNVPLS